MRVFVAIDLPREVKDELILSSQIVEDNSISCSLVPETNYHITIAFLGDIEINQLETLKKCLDETFDKSFDLSILGFEKFTRSYGDIIFRKAVIAEDIYQKINYFRDYIKENGVPHDGEKFKPHITISRQTYFKEGLNTESFKLKPIKCHIDKITIFESVLREGQKAKYLTLYERKLK